MQYKVVFEKAPKNWAAYVPDLPGCVTTGKTLAETKRLIAEAIEFHIEGLRLRGGECAEAFHGYRCRRGLTGEET